MRTNDFFYWDASARMRQEIEKKGGGTLSTLAVSFYRFDAFTRILASFILYYYYYLIYYLLWLLFTILFIMSIIYYIIYYYYLLYYLLSLLLLGKIVFSFQKILLINFQGFWGNKMKKNEIRDLRKLNFILRLLVARDRSIRKPKT